MADDWTTRVLQFSPDLAFRPVCKLWCNFLSRMPEMVDRIQFLKLLPLEFRCSTQASMGFLLDIRCYEINFEKGQATLHWFRQVGDDYSSEVFNVPDAAWILRETEVEIFIRNFSFCMPLSTVIKGRVESEVIQPWERELLDNMRNANQNQELAVGMPRVHQEMQQRVYGHHHGPQDDDQEEAPIVQIGGQHVAVHQDILKAYPNDPGQWRTNMELRMRYFSV